MTPSLVRGDEKTTALCDALAFGVISHQHRGIRTTPATMTCIVTMLLYEYNPILSIDILARDALRCTRYQVET